jgi:dolichol-phosphate mannosyltransferase
VKVGPKGIRVCVVVPTYNERENIRPLVEAVRGSGAGAPDILFVDDSSPDGTGDEVVALSRADPRIHLLSRPSKMGLGTAYMQGFAEAKRSIGPDVYVEMDADLQHPPAVLPTLLEAIAGGAGGVIASRYVTGGGSTGWSLWRRTVSRGANWLARRILGLETRDCTSGYRAFTKESVNLLLGASLPAAGYSFQVAALYRLKREGATVVEVPFVFSLRAHGKSKLSMGEVGRFFLALVKLRFSAP